MQASVNVRNCAQLESPKRRIVLYLAMMSDADAGGGRDIFPNYVGLGIQW